MVDLLSLQTTTVSPPPFCPADVASPPLATSANPHEEFEEHSGESFKLVCNPFIGMEFETVDVSEEFWIKYGYETGFGVRIQNTNVRKDGIVTSRTYVCSKQGQKGFDKRRVNSKSRPDFRCGCGVLMRVSLKRETGKYCVKEFVENHNHDLEGNKTIHNVDITKFIKKRWSRSNKSNRKGELSHSLGLSNEQKIDILEVECRKVIDRVVKYDDEVFEGIRRIISSAHSFIDERTVSKGNSGENVSPVSLEPVNTQNGAVGTVIKNRNTQKLSVKRCMAHPSPSNEVQPLPISDDSLSLQTISAALPLTVADNERPPSTDSADVASPPTTFVNEFHAHANKVSEVEIEKQFEESSEFVRKAFIGMEFNGINASESFWKRYGFETGFGVRIQYTNVRKDGIVTSRTYVCSKQGQKGYDKRRVNSKSQPDKRCNCSVSMKVSLSRETGKYYVKEFVEKHNHDLQRWTRNGKSNCKAVINNSHGLSNVQKVDILKLDSRRIIDRVVRYNDEVFEGVRHIINSARLFIDDHITLKERSGDNISPVSFEPVNIPNGVVVTELMNKTNQKLSVTRCMVYPSTGNGIQRPPTMDVFLSLQTSPTSPPHTVAADERHPPTDSADVASPLSAFINEFHPHVEKESEEQYQESIELVDKPFIGMEFDAISASDFFWKRYGYETRFGARIQNSIFGKDKIVTSRTYVCSKQGQKAKDKQRVNSKPWLDKRCNCGVFMRVSLSRETGKYYVKDFLEKHNHDLEETLTTHNRKAITKYFMKSETRNAESNHSFVMEHFPGLSNSQKNEILEGEFRRIGESVVEYDNEVFEGVRRIINSAHSYIDEHIMSEGNIEENNLPASFEPVNIQDGVAVAGVSGKRRLVSCMEGELSTKKFRA